MSALDELINAYRAAVTHFKADHAYVQHNEPWWVEQAQQIIESAKAEKE